jgi:hypothetical protein
MRFFPVDVFPLIDSFGTIEATKLEHFNKMDCYKVPFPELHSKDALHLCPPQINRILATAVQVQNLHVQATSSGQPRKGFVQRNFGNRKETPNPQSKLETVGSFHRHSSTVLKGDGYVQFHCLSLCSS